jgi:hypothetical protein
MLQFEMTSPGAGAQRAPRRSELVRLARIVAGSADVLLLGMAALFFLRRLTGGLLTPLSGLALLLVGVLLVSLASVLRAPWLASRGLHVSGGRAPRVARALGLSAPFPALVLFALALSSPNAATWSVVLLWLIVAAHELGWAALWRRGQVHELWPRPGRQRTRSGAARNGGAESAPAAQTSVGATDEQLPAAVTQQIVRSTDAEGVDDIHGTLRAQFAAAERTQSLHVAFCPPLSETPTMQCEQVDGPPARLTIAEVQSYGARIDMRLARVAAEPTSVTLEFQARCAKAKGKR